jgi:hypothetical protein
VQRGGEENCSSAQLAGLDEFVEGGGFFRRGDPQFLFQDTHALLVLAQGGGALVGPGVQLHQPAVGLFVQRVEAQPAAGIVHGWFIFAHSTMATHQALQGTSQLAA